MASKGLAWCAILREANVYQQYCLLHYFAMCQPLVLLPCLLRSEVRVWRINDTSACFWMMV